MYPFMAVSLPTSCLDGTMYIAHPCSGGTLPNICKLRLPWGVAVRRPGRGRIHLRIPPVHVLTWLAPQRLVIISVDLDFRFVFFPMQAVLSPHQKSLRKPCAEAFGPR